MLVQNSVYRNTYLTDGVNKDFYFSFPILEASQVLVQTSLLTDTETVTTVDPGQYTVTGVGQTTGGHISFTTAPPTGSRLALTLNIPITQLYQYAELDSFPAKSHEDALAKLTLICQQLREQLERAVMLPPTSSESPETVVARIYASRDAAAASASAASAQATAAKGSASAASNKATAAAGSANAAAISADLAYAASQGMAPRMDAAELKNAQQDTRLDYLRGVYVTTGDVDLLDPGFYICDNSSGNLVHSPTINGRPYRGAYVLWKKGLPSGPSWLVYDHAVTFEGALHEWHRAFVPTRGSWSAWTDTMEIPSYSKVFRATNSLDARLSLQAASGYDNVTLWPTGGKLGVTRNTGDTSTENESMLLDPAAGTINGVLPAPRPTAANFVTCGATLPAGGTWAYCVNCWNSTGYYIQTYSGVAAGGTTVAGGANFFGGFAWRVA